MAEVSKYLHFIILQAKVYLIHKSISKGCFSMHMSNYLNNLKNPNRSVHFESNDLAYTYGSGGIYGCKYFIDEDIVVVTFNYRLGVLGKLIQLQITILN